MYTGTSANFSQAFNDVFFRLFARLVANFPSADQMIGAGMHPKCFVLANIFIDSNDSLCLDFGS